MNQVLRSIYYDVRNPAGFGSKEKLFAAASQILPGITRADVNEWLSREHVYTLHRPVRRNFTRNPVVSSGKGQHAQSDLVDMQQFSSWNDGYRYILTLIDVFSKEAAALPLKTKSMNEVSQALDELLCESPCQNLWTDGGKEYENQEVQKVIDKHNMTIHFTRNTQIKCSIAERFNRTLKSKMYRYFTMKNTRRYVDVLDALVNAYNHSHHRSIKMRPVDVHEENSSIVFRNLYGFANERQMILAGSDERPKFNVGDTVRVRYFLPQMEKSYFPTYTDQTFKVHAAVLNYPRTMYRLENWEGNVIDRKYYADELQKVSPDTSYRVERILKRQGDKVLVKWNGYPKRANSWIDSASLDD